MYLKPRDWQLINVMGKRWRILRAGFEINHLIPIQNGEKTTGGAVTSSTTFNLLPYIEVYIDKGYQLPLHKPATKDIPNKQGSQNSGNQTTAALEIINVNRTRPFSVSTAQEETLRAWAKKGGANAPVMDLMNSMEWDTCKVNESFSFEWTANKEDLVWRHGCHIDYHNNANNVHLAPANPFGRWDGGYHIDDAGDISTANWQVIWNTNHQPIKPMPACLIRPVTIHDETDTLVPITFQCLCRYYCEIEIDMNDIGFRPLQNRFISETKDWEFKNTFDLYGTDGTTTGTNTLPVYNQWSGGNIGGDFRSGPNQQRIIV